MNTFTHAAMPLKLFGAVLALALIAAVAAAIALTTGPTQAQSDLPGSTPTPPPVNVYADPQPCGPGPDKLADASMNEPHERTTGHYALFDTYWENTTPDPGETRNLEPVNTGILHTNTCPPLVSQTTRSNPEDEDGPEITVTTYSKSEVDIDELIIHVEDLRKVAVVATDAEVTDGQISLGKYPGLYEALGLGENDPVPPDTEVWLLRTDDPSTAVDESAVDDPDTDVDETETEHSNGLSLGFSTWRLNPLHWAKAGNAAPLRYAFELERERGILPENEAHMITYRVDQENRDAVREEIWNSFSVHTQPLDMEPGQFESFEWIFTDAGTYELSVHLIGWVNHDRPTGDAGQDWEAISAKVTESSEVKAYTIQVGDELLENEPPVFGVSLTAPENSPAGTLVGGPIPIFEGEADTFYYELVGDDQTQFELEAVNHPHGVQIKVAEGANLDYETKPIYEFRLNVTDKIDHESNPDLTIDDSMAVRIALENVPEAPLSATDTNPQLGQRVELTVTRDAPAGSTVALTWYQKTENDEDWSVVHLYGDDPPYRGHQLIVHRHPNQTDVLVDHFKVKMDWGTGRVWSNVITLHWREAQ